MEDNSSTSSDSDNALLHPKEQSRIGRNAATQTPVMGRHEIRVPEVTVNKSADNSAIMVYKLDTQKTMTELEQDAKNLSIPDVVVEYIKDSIAKEELGGTANSSFEPQELIVVRTPSCISLRDEVNRSEENDMALVPMGKDNPLYNSITREQRKVGGSTNGHQKLPGLLSVLDPTLSASQSSLIPRSFPPSPNFGYRPLESETSAIYTIISPVRYIGNGGDKELEMRLLAQLEAQLEKEKATKRKFEFCTTPTEVETKRRRLQLATDICSLLFLIPGIIIAIITPIALIPLFILPLKYYVPLIALFILSGTTAVISMAISGIIGNIVWHYNDKTQKMRPKLHCGTGPLRHFWGNGFYPNYQTKVPPKVPPEKMV